VCKECLNKIVAYVLTDLRYRRVNPFNQSQETSATDGAAAAATADGSTFPVRFVGSQQVLTDRGTWSTTAVNVDCEQFYRYVSGTACMECYVHM